MCKPRAHAAAHVAPLALGDDSSDSDFAALVDLPAAPGLPPGIAPPLAIEDGDSDSGDFNSGSGHSSSSDSNDEDIGPAAADVEPLVEEAVAQPEGFIDVAYREAGFVEVDNELFRRSPAGILERFGQVQFMHGATFSLKVLCHDCRHAPLEGASRHTAQGRACYFLINCTNNFNDKLKAGLKWLGDGHAMVRDEHIREAARLRASFA